MKTLTAKLLNENLKKGWTASDFASYLEVTEDEFWTLLKKTFSPKPLRDFNSRLSQNEKKHKKTLAANSEIKNGFEKAVEFSVPFNNEEKAKEEKGISGETNSGESKISLRDLERLEAKLQKEVCDTEKNIANLHASKHKIRGYLAQEQKFLDSIMTQIEQHKEEIKKLLESHNSLLSKIEFENTKLKADIETLESIRSQIEAQKKVCIYAYSNGNIEFENNSFDIPETWSDVYEKLIKIEEFEALTIKQIKQLSKIFVLVESFKENKIQYELIFDSEEMQNCFQMIK